MSNELRRLVTVPGEETSICALRSCSAEEDAGKEEEKSECAEEEEKDRLRTSPTTSPRVALAALAGWLTYELTSERGNDSAPLTSEMLGDVVDNVGSLGGSNGCAGWLAQDLDEFPRIITSPVKLPRIGGPTCAAGDASRAYALTAEARWRAAMRSFTADERVLKAGGKEGEDVGVCCGVVRWVVVRGGKDMVGVVGLRGGEDMAGRGRVESDVTIAHV